MTKRLAHVLSLPLTLHHSLASNIKRERKRDPESHKFDNVPPELALIATCIMVLKMVYGLDDEDETRYGLSTRWLRSFNFSLLKKNGEQASEGDERPGMCTALFTRVFSVA